MIYYLPDSLAKNKAEKNEKESLVEQVENNQYSVSKKDLY